MSVIALKTNNLKTPAQFVEQMTDRLDDLDGVVQVCLWKDGTISAGWTTMQNSRLCMAEKVLSMTVTSELAGS